MNIKGEIAKRILIEQRIDIENELYLSITVDRASKRPIVIASAMGGMDIEEVAATNPSAIAKYCVNRRVAIGRSSGVVWRKRRTSLRR